MNTTSLPTYSPDANQQATSTTPLNSLAIPPVFTLYKDSIKVGSRIREDYGSPEELQDLADSIRDHGLIHPLAVDEAGNLVAGGRRYHVLTTILNWEFIPVTLATTGGDIANLRMMELEENVKRKEMNWKEKVNCIAEVHALHVRKAALKSEKWSKLRTGDLLGIAVGNVQYCVDISYILKSSPDHPIQKCDSLNEAFKTLLQLKQDEIERENSKFALEISNKTAGGFSTPGATLSIDSLIQGLNNTEAKEAVANMDIEGLVSAMETATGEKITDGVILTKAETEARDGSVPVSTSEGPKPKLLIKLSDYYQKGDCIQKMLELEANSIDHCVTDIPYGIDMDMLEQDNTGMVDIDRVADEHQVDENIQLFHDFFPNIYRVLKPNSFLVIWYDLDYHDLFKKLGLASGFKVCRWPLHWVKTHVCKNQAAQYNPTKAVEHALIFRKGTPTLAQVFGVNYWTGSGDEARKDFQHPFAKPEGLWRWVYQAIAPKGSVIFDPFAGSCSSLIAAMKAGYYPRGFEIKDIHYNRGVTKMQELLRNWFKDREVIFE